MKHMEIVQSSPTPWDWDWHRSLTEQERSCAWLARKTGCHPMTVYRYAWGQRTPSIGWLRRAHAVLEGNRRNAENQ